MRIAICFTALLTGGLLASTAVAEELKLDTEKSKIEFVGTKPDGKHDGGFKKFTAVAEKDAETPSDSSMAIKIDATSLWADDDRLTAHLKSPDFFDVRKHPEITFESTKVIHGEQGAATIIGKLKMLGKEVEVKIPVKSKSTDEAIVMLTAFTIDRTKWGMTYGQGKVDNEVKISADLHFKR